MTPNKQLRFEISQTGVESGRRRGLRRGGGGGGRGKNRKIMFFHSFFNESLAKTRLKTFRQLP